MRWINSIKGWTVISHGTVKGQRRQAKKEMKPTYLSRFGKLSLRQSTEKEKTRQTGKRRADIKNEGKRTEMKTLKSRQRKETNKKHERR